MTRGCRHRILLTLFAMAITVPGRAQICPGDTKDNSAITNGDFSNAEEGVLFDVNGHGSLFWLGWPRSSDDAWLALDRNGNGIIDSGAELFGNTRVLRSGVNAQNGYEVLAELDENGDGLISAEDPDYSRLLLWRDSDRDGVSQPREIVGMVAAGIVSLSVEYWDSRRHDGWGNRFRFVAVDGCTADVFPVWCLPDSRLEAPE